MSGASKIQPVLTWRSAIADSDLDSTTRLVAWALSLYMSDRGDSAYPGPTRLAHDTALHVSTVKAHLKTLTERGWVEVVEKGGTRGGSRKANVYRACIPDALPVVHDDRSPTTTGRSDRADPSSSAQVPVVQDDPISSENSPKNESSDDDPLSSAGKEPNIAREITTKYWDWATAEFEREPAETFLAIQAVVSGALKRGATRAQIGQGLKAIEAQRPRRPTITIVTLFNAIDGLRAGRPSGAQGTNDSWIEAAEAKTRAYHEGTGDGS